MRDIVFAAATQSGGAAAGGATEYVTNGDFASAAGWTLGIWTIGSGVANSNADDSDLTRTAAIIITPGTYRCTFTIVSGGDSVVPLIGGTLGSAGGTIAGAGAKSRDVVVASVVSQLVGLRSSADVGNGVIIDNLSVVKIA